MARQYHVYRGEPERTRILGRMHSYHGNTLGALAAGNNPMRRAVMAPLLGAEFHHLARCFFEADGAGLDAARAGIASLQEEADTDGDAGDG